MEMEKRPTIRITYLAPLGEVETTSVALDSVGLEDDLEEWHTYVENMTINGVWIDEQTFIPSNRILKIKIPKNE